MVRLCAQQLSEGASPCFMQNVQMQGDAVAATGIGVLGTLNRPSHFESGKQTQAGSCDQIEV